MQHANMQHANMQHANMQHANMQHATCNMRTCEHASMRTGYENDVLPYCFTELLIAAARTRVISRISQGESGYLTSGDAT